MKYNKEKIKEIILTDYLDNRLDEDKRREIDQIIERDPELKEFYQTVIKTSVEPFEVSNKLEPPEKVWKNIKAEITQEAPKKSFELMGDIMFGWIALPRLPLAIGSSMAILLFVVYFGFIRTQVHRNYNTDDQVEYLMLLTNIGGDSSVEQKKGFGTNIENYFL